MNDKKSHALTLAKKELEDGNAQAAFRAISPWISWPCSFESGSDWADTWNVFGEVAAELIGVNLLDVVSEAAERPTDPHALYALGYELVEVGLPEAGASALMRADELAPGNEPIIGELVHALEMSGFNDAAIEVLQANPQMLEKSFMLRYLLAFNAVMCADLGLARETYARLTPTDEEEGFMAARIASFLDRATGIERVSTLTDKDLRGWHFVTNGAILLHLSPYGLEEPMHGRYAFVQDSVAVCKEGVERVVEVLNTWDEAPETIFYLADRDSHILALALARLLGLTAVEWPNDGASDPGMIVSYDLSAASEDQLESLYLRSPGQILWSHAACWTDVPAYAADLHTFLYQHNAAPWDARLQVDDDGEVRRVEPDDAPAQEWADRVLAAEPSAESLADLDELRAFARVAAELPEQSRPTALLDVATNRPRFWDCSPVKSNLFE